MCSAAFAALLAFLGGACAFETPPTQGGGGPHAGRAISPPPVAVPAPARPAVEAPAVEAPAAPAPALEKPRDGYVRVFDAWPIAGPDAYDGLLARAAHRHLPYRECFGVPAEVWLKAQMMQESSGDPRAESGTGPVGLMQISIGLGRDYAVADRFDPEQSVDAGARYLAWQYGQWSAYDRTCEERLPLALTGYAEGLGELLGLQPETGARYFPEFLPHLSPQGQHYYPRIRARIGGLDA